MFTDQMFTDQMFTDESSFIATTQFPPEGPSAQGQRCAIVPCSDPRPSALGPL
jgi:hypothetical protein